MEKLSKCVYLTHHCCTLLFVILCCGYTSYVHCQRYYGRAARCRSFFQTLHYTPCNPNACEGNSRHSACCFQYSLFGGRAKCRCPSYANCGFNHHGARRPGGHYLNPPQGQYSNPRPASPVRAPPQRGQNTTQNPQPFEEALTNVGFCGSQYNFRHVCPLDSCRSADNKDVCCMRQDLQSPGNPLVCSCHPAIECFGTQEASSEGSGESVENPDDDSVEIEEETTEVEAESSENDSGDNFEESSGENEEEPRARSLCRAQNRILNGNLVEDECEYMGIAKLETTHEGEIRSVCNAIYTVAKVGGATKATFLTSQMCKTLVEAVLESEEEEGITTDIQIGIQRYPVQPPIFNLVDGSNGNAFIDINPRFSNLFSYLGQCQQEACPYNPDTMSGLITMGDCKAVGWGDSDASTLRTDGLFEVSVQLDPQGCTEIEDLLDTTDTMCFRTTSGRNMYCHNDAGAPVYCRALSSNEWILMGILAFQTGCDESPWATVIPFPL